MSELLKKIQLSLKSRYMDKARLPRLFNETSSEISQSFINVSLLKKDVVEAKEKELNEAHQADERLYSHEQLYVEHEPVALEQLFSPLSNDESTSNKLIIYGRAGIGKSVLCQYIATQW